ncbi:MAG: phosphatidylserine decarboxylase [Clostridia bacterium]|nr:phosphatidylserine decarboxylase [Clostridia bacterium]
MVLDRNGKEVHESAGQAKFLSFLYRGLPGRVLLRLLRSRRVSCLMGAYMDSPLSRGRVKKALKNGMDMEGVEETVFPNYNALFTRKRKDGTFPFSQEEGDFCSPADSRMTVYPLKEGTAFPVKLAPYTASELLGSEEEGAYFRDGYAFVFRLCPEDYHRYAFFDGGKLLSSCFIKGTFHTVNPVALAKLPVFHRNCRNVSVLETEHFGRCAYVEVGAMMVGRIINHGQETFARGEEKGYFAFGGSTVVVLVGKDVLTPCEDIVSNSNQGIETYVRAGETVGRRV